MKLQRKANPNEGLADQAETWHPDDEFGDYQSQEASTGPPLKHFWGLISVGLVILLLGVTTIFLFAQETDGQAVSQHRRGNEPLPFLAQPGDKDQHSQPQSITSEIEPVPKRYRIRIVGNSPGAYQDNPSHLFAGPESYAKSLLESSIEEERHLIDDYGVKITLLKTMPISGISKDGQAAMQGQLSVWTSESAGFVYVTVDAEITPSQAEKYLSGSKDEAKYDHKHDIFQGIKQFRIQAASDPDIAYHQDGLTPLGMSNNPDDRDFEEALIFWGYQSSGTTLHRTVPLNSQSQAGQVDFTGQFSIWTNDDEGQFLWRLALDIDFGSNKDNKEPYQRWLSTTTADTRLIDAFMADCLVMTAPACE